jgi:hypothetical protein
MISDLLAWFDDHQTILISVLAVSVVTFLATLFATPRMLLRIPPDYFTHHRRPPGVGSGRGRAVRWTIRIVKNAVAVVCVLAGLAMLALPGQGLLTILIGLLLLEFPGKYALEKRLIAGPRVFAALNRFRTRRGRRPLDRPPPHPAA